LAWPQLPPYAANEPPSVEVIEEPEHRPQCSVPQRRSAGKPAA